MTSARGFVWLGLIALPVVSIGFASVGVGFGVAVLAAVLLVVLPALAVAQLGVELPAEIDTMAVYWSTAVVVGILGVASLLIGFGTPGLSAMGLGPIDPISLGLGSAIASVAGLAILAGARVAASGAGWGETDLVRLVMPSDGRERRAFVGVSLAAGFGEEIAYRGFLLALLIQTFGDAVGALLLTSLAFGLLHAYQGVIGMVRTALIGAAFAWITIAVGSLWPVVVGHVIINLMAGLVLGDWLLDTES